MLQLVELHLDRCGSCFDVVTVLARLPSTANAQRTLSRGATLGRYVVLQRLGAGAMGVVYAAYDPELERKVAVKLLLPTITAAEGSARLLREAKLLARLSHPNVVTVHDVGSFGDQVFIAMELVEGETATHWLAERPRSWREVLALFRAAGEGLAAAHRAGLVHRDFKPDNVLVDRDPRGGRGGHPRVRVTDFGLARSPETHDDGTREAHRVAGDADPLSTLTRTGTLLGTPAYMAPEQLEGSTAGAAADQYSFCVALYEALYRERPFAGSTIEVLATAKSRGEIKPPPKHTKVPRWLREVVVRGLATEPAARHPSMDHLLAALAAERRTVRRRVVAAGLAVIAIAAVLVLQLRDTEPSGVCRGAERHLAGVWDPARTIAVERAFLATRLPFAATSWTAIEKQLSDYARDWTAMHTGACEATRVHGEQSERVLDARMACLDDRLSALAAVTEVLSHANAETVVRASEVVGSLPAIAGCANTKALLDGSVTADESVQRSATEIQRQLHRVAALVEAARYEEAKPVLDRALADALRLGYLPVSAKAHRQAGVLADHLDDYPRMRDELFEALWAAEAAGDSALVASVAVALANVQGFHLGHPDDGRKWARFARAAAFRAGHDDALESSIESVLAEIERIDGQWSTSLAHAERAYELARRAGMSTLEETEVLARSLQVLGRYDEALVHFDHVYREVLSTRGGEHPLVARAAAGRGSALQLMGRYEEALADYQTSVAIYEKTHKSSDLSLAGEILNQGTAELALGRTRAAETSFRRALSIMIANNGPTRDICLARNNLATALSESGQLVEALAEHEAVLALRRQALGAEHPDVAMSLSNIGDTLRKLGRYRDSLARHREALAIEDKLQPDHPDNAYDLSGTGEALLHLARTTEAIAPLERALQLRERANVEPALVAESKYLLGRALWTARQDQKRADELLAAASEELANLGPAGKRRLTELKAWLAIR